MKIQEIKAAVDAGKTVKWANDSYDVIKHRSDYYIKCSTNGDVIGLHGLAGTKYADQLNGAPEKFYISEESK